MSRRNCFLALGVNFFSCGVWAAQQTTNWVGGSGNWNVPGNWSGGAVPDNGTSTWSVNVDNGQTASSSATLNISVTIDKLTVSPGDLLHIGNQRYLTVVAGTNAGTITNRGSISVDADSSNSGLKVSGGDVTLTGSGTVTLADATTSRIIGVTAATDRLINENNIIQGAGTIGANAMGLINRGTIRANGTQTLTISPSALNVVNRGTMTATDGGTLKLGAGTYSNFEGSTPGTIRADGGTLTINGAVTGGTVSALAGGRINVDGGTVTGGTLTGVSGGTISVTGAATLGGTITNPAGSTLIVNPSADLTFASGSTLTNSGTIAMTTVSTQTNIMLGGNLTLTGAGSVTLTDSTSNRIVGVVGGEVFTNSDNSIIGAGQIGVDQLKLVNSGSIIAQGTNKLTLDPNDTTGCTNTGLLQASAGGTLRLTDGVFTNTGGTIEALSGGLVELASITLLGGNLTTGATGTIRATSNEVFDGRTNPITVNGALNIAAGNNVTAVGSLMNYGVIQLETGSTSTRLKVDGTTLTLSGFGALHMGDNAQNAISGLNGGSLMNQGNTICGGGKLGDDSLAITNSGTIVANSSAILTINPSSGGFVNGGTIRAANGHIALLKDGVYTNTLGMIIADDGGTIQLADSVQVIGGTLQSVDNGIIMTFGNPTLDGSNGGITTSGLLEIENGDDVYVRGTWTNTGTINLKTTDQNTRIYVDSSTVTLSGGGTIVLADDDQSSIEATGVASLVNTDNVIRGAGDIGEGFTSFTNRGTIQADGRNELAIHPDNAGFSNEGLIQIIGAGGLGIRTGPFTNSGTIVVALGSILNRLGDFVQTAGCTMVAGELTATGIIDIRGGMLQAMGLLSASVTNSGTFSPGPGLVPVLLSKDFTQTASGTLSVEVGSQQTDHVLVTGNVNLAGTLEIIFSLSDPPQPGDNFEIISAANISGRFDSIRTLNLPANQQISLSYISGRLIALVGATLDGGAASSDAADDAPPFDNDWHGGIYVNDGLLNGGGLNEALLETIRLSPWLAGVQVNLTWADMEPQKDQYNWALVDEYLDAYETIGRRVGFKFFCVGGEVESDDPQNPNNVYVNSATPSWVLTDPRVRTIGEIATPQGMLARYPVYWDAVYLGYLKDFIAAFGARYGQDDRIEFFRMAGWQVGTNEPNFYAYAAHYMADQIAANGMSVDFASDGSAILVPGTPYESAIQQLIESYRTNFGIIPLVATIKFDSPTSLYESMNSYCAARAIGLVNTGLNEGDKSVTRARFRDWHDNYHCRVGWGGVTNLGTKLTQAELDALGHTLWQETMYQAIGIDGDARYNPAGATGYVILGDTALYDVPALQWGATRLLFKE